jgi:hypothetical protein
MDISEVKRNLNKPVRYVNKRLYIDADYVFKGCMIRRNKRGFYYQAELEDANSRSVVIARLNDITGKEDPNEVNGGDQAGNRSADN